MRKFVIISDTGCDLEKSLRDQYDIQYLPISFSCEGKEYVADLDWNSLPAKEFYDRMRNGARFVTSQINVETYKETYRKYVQDGYDVLSISSSSALSATIMSSRAAAEEVMREFPEGKIICVDSLRGCHALGILVLRASELRAEGKTIEETANMSQDTAFYTPLWGSEAAREC